MGIRRLNNMSDQKKISVVFSIAGIVIVLINLSSKISEVPLKTALLDKSVLLLGLIMLPLIFTSFFESLMSKIIQVTFIGILGTLAILDEYNAIHGLGLILLVVIILFRYGFFKKYAKSKFTILIGYTVTVTEYSARIQYPNGKWMTGADTLMYIIIFLTICYLIYYSEIKSYIEKAKEAEMSVEKLKDERFLLEARLEELDARIQDIEKPYDLDSAGITPAEKKVIEALCVYRETERILAKRLGLSMHTIKNHFRHIRDKLGVDRREEILDLCRNNFK